MCSEIGDGLHSAPVYDENGKYYFINGNNLVNSKIIVNETETKRVSEETFKKNNKNLDDTTILLSINGTIGNLAYYNDEMVMLGKSAAYLKVMNIEKKFLYTSLQTSNTINSFMSSLTGTTIKNLGLEAIKKTQIFMPCEKEQTAIGKYFQNLDNLITLHQRKYESLVNIKKAMLEKMFPKNEEVVPELRFAGFTDTWEQRKLSTICSMHARIGWQNLRTSEFLDTGDYYLITGTDFDNGRVNLDNCHYVDKSRYEQDTKIQIQNGSILITKDGTLGKVAFVEGLDKPATLNAGVFNVEITKNFVDNKYLFQYLKAPFLMDYVDKKATGGTIKHLNQNILVDFPIAMPKVEEQRLIGEYFSHLDHLITLHQRELEKLQNIKKSCLEKMFI